VFLGDPGQHEFLSAKVVHINLAALQYQPGLLENHIPTFGFHRSESGLCHLVAVASRFGAADLQRLAVLLGEKAEGVTIAPVGESIGIALGTDPCDGNGQVPHDAHMTPAGGHHVEFTNAPGGHQHPVFVEHFKNIVGDVGGSDVGEIFHGQGSLCALRQSLIF